MSCNCPQCCLNQSSNNEDPGCCCSGNNDTFCECDYVQGRFTVAWMTESPDLCPAQTCGYQLEFCERPCCVRQIFKQLCEWINCPPVEDGGESCEPPPCSPRRTSPCRTFSPCSQNQPRTCCCKSPPPCYQPAKPVPKKPCCRSKKVKVRKTPTNVVLYAKNNNCCPAKGKCKPSC